MNINDFTADYDPKDISDNKNVSVLSYLGILFLIPLLSRKNSYYARFHVNQGLVLLIVEVALNTVQRLLGIVFNLTGLVFLPVILNFIFAVLNILCLTLMVIGIINTVNGRAKELPIIGKIRLIK